MKSAAHPAAMLLTTGYTEHVDAKTHPALLSLHATSPTLFPMILWGLLFLFSFPVLTSSLSTSPRCFLLFLYLSLSEDCRAPEASNSSALGQTLIKTAC